MNSFHTALANLTAADALVVGICLNNGDSNILAVFCASHFVSEQTLAYTLQPHNGQSEGGFIEPVTEVYMRPEPIEITFTNKPIILFQSEASVSAAKTFALSLIQLPDVTTVGQPTARAFSDALVRSTLNGWTFGLSPEYI